MFAFSLYGTSLLMEAIGSYISVIGLSHLFAGSATVMLMAVVLDLGKIMSVTYLYREWSRVSGTIRAYMLAAVLVLMVITSAGVFGFLSQQFAAAISSSSQDRTVLVGLKEEAAVLTTRKAEIEAYTLKIDPNAKLTARQMTLLRSYSAEKTSTDRRLTEVNAEIRKLSTTGAAQHSVEMGAILYIADAFSTTPEQAAKWIIFTIIFVFDPLAIALLVAANQVSLRKPEEPVTVTPEAAAPEHEVIEARVPKGEVSDVIQPDVAEVPLQLVPLEKEVLTDAPVFEKEMLIDEPVIQHVTVSEVPEPVKPPARMRATPGKKRAKKAKPQPEVKYNEEVAISALDSYAPIDPRLKSIEFIDGTEKVDVRIAELVEQYRKL